MKMTTVLKRKWTMVLLCAVLAVGGVLTAPFGAQGAGLLVADGGFGGVLEIEEHDVKVTINNGIAVTEVNQVFANTENRQVEALYTFPVPKQASVANFSMWIGGKEMIGEVLEKERAREIYNSYKQQRRDPGLLEQVNCKTFEMRIFPIGPKAKQRVRVTYYQELDFDCDRATYVYPLATTTRKNIDQRTSGKFALTLEAKSEAPIVAMDSPSHKAGFVIVPHGEHYYQASLETSGGELSRDLVLSYQVARARTGLDLIASRTAGEDGYFCLSMTAGQELAQLNPGMDYVFILDISGSMANDDKLRQSRESAGAFINALGEDDRFEVITFNIRLTTLFNKMSPVTVDTRSAAGGFLASQKAAGGTVLSPALATAYRYKAAERQLNVVILSDGMTEQKERQALLASISGKPEKTRVFCIGVGNDVNRPLLRQLAEDAGGLAAFVSRGDDFERQATAFRRKLIHPVASDVKINLKGVDVYDLEPQKLPNLYHGAPLRLYGRYKKGGAAQISVSADVAGHPLAQTVELELPARGDDNPELERMWAWHKVQRLLKEADRAGSRDGVLDEIVRLGEGYSIATEYTSFLVLENDAEYQRWKIDRRNALRIDRDRKQQEKLRTQLEAMRAETLAGLGPTQPDEKQEVAMGQPARQTTVRGAPSNSTPAPSTTRQAPPRRSSRGVDFKLPSGGGGGAIDPISGAIALGLGGLAYAARRRKKNQPPKG